MSIPGAIDCPGAELVYRITDLAGSDETLVVVNCAGRTRSIIGAQSLIDAGAPNRVMALRNGTMGWHLAGFELEHGCARLAPEVSAAGAARAREMAAAVGASAGVCAIGPDTLERWRAESDARTLYVFDVRAPEEYAAGHLPGARPAPGGQLVQKTDAFMATRGGRVVLVDADGVRATMTAAWLRRMGLDDVVVFDQRRADGALEVGWYRPQIPGLGDARPTTITAAALARLPAASTFVLTSDDGVLARLGLQN